MLSSRVVKLGMKFHLLQLDGLPFDFLVVSDMLRNETYHWKQNFLAQLMRKEFLTSDVQKVDFGLIQASICFQSFILTNHFFVARRVC